MYVKLGDALPYQALVLRLVSDTYVDLGIAPFTQSAPAVFASTDFLRFSLSD